VESFVDFFLSLDFVLESLDFPTLNLEIGRMKLLKGLVALAAAAGGGDERGDADLRPQLLDSPGLLPPGKLLPEDLLAGLSASVRLSRKAPLPDITFKSSKLPPK
jgi:hypothetical protein